ncbi:major facilitator superfamily protein [Klebsiella pneumoniae]|uniref:Major facilitator superfamily protein n=1 Tax=Klebsiella pneumoniae TaxID=573 RepID=A0A377UWV8_KLEPN|nr:major facilitator superfamily protein [Klebsiella pneumoniae]
MSGIIAFFRASPPKAGAAFDEHRFRRVRWQTFIAMTLAYVTFYVCRLSFTVAKSALVELGITPTELGMIGSTLFFSYAIGKLVNGFIADHANVVRYMSLGLLLSAGMNLMMGMTTNALLLAIFWGINGWAQSMGVGPCAVSLARWYGVKERGTFYGIWSTAHNIGEAVTYMVIAAVIAGFGWQMGYLSTAALGAAGVVLLVLFMHDSPQSAASRPSTSSAMNRRRRSKPAARCLKTSCWRCATRRCGPSPSPPPLCTSTATPSTHGGSSFWSRIKLIPRWRRPGLSASTLSPHRRDHHRRHALRPLFPAQPQRDGRIHQPAEHRRLRPDALVRRTITTLIFWR